MLSTAKIVSPLTSTACGIPIIFSVLSSSDMVAILSKFTPNGFAFLTLIESVLGVMESTSTISGVLVAVFDLSPHPAAMRRDSERAEGKIADFFMTDYFRERSLINFGGLTSIFVKTVRDAVFISKISKNILY